MLNEIHQYFQQKKTSLEAAYRGGIGKKSVRLKFLLSLPRSLPNSFNNPQYKVYYGISYEIMTYIHH